MPTSKTASGIAAQRHLTPSQLDHYHQQGYVLVKNLLDPATDIDPVLAEYDQILENLANELHAQNRIASTYADLPFDQRLCTIYNETGQIHAQHFDISLPQGGTRADSPIAAGPAAFWMLRNKKLLDIIEDIIGPEVYSNPVQHIRIKPPEQYLPGVPKDQHGRIAGFAVGATPWHQDNGVVLPEADETDMLTVWLPLTNALREHGCIEVVAGSQRDGLLHHCSAGYGLYIQDKHLAQDRIVTAEMKKGDVLFMHRLTCHSSLPNTSEQVRISFDLRYNPTGQPTGRPVFPGFVARSRKDPASELRDPEVWAQSWYDAREKLAINNMPAYNRWPTDDPACA